MISHGEVLVCEGNVSKFEIYRRGWDFFIQIMANSMAKNI